MTAIMSADDKKWRGRNAANTLAEAERIKSDPVLSKLAAKEAVNMMKEHQQSMESMEKVRDTVVKPRAKRSAPRKTKTK